MHALDEAMMKRGDELMLPAAARPAALTLQL
jgi:hypothetical protein